MSLFNNFMSTLRSTLKGITVANQKNLKLSHSKARSVSELAPQSLLAASGVHQKEDKEGKEGKEQGRQRLIEQNKRLKKQALQLAEQMDEILSQQKFKRKYGLCLGEEGNRETHLKRLQARQQELRIQQLRTQLALVKRQNQYVHDEAGVVAKEDAIRSLEKEVKALQDERTALLNVRKQQFKGLDLIQNGEKYQQKIDKTKAQLAKIKEQCKILSAKTAEHEKQLLRNHERTVARAQRLKEMEDRIREHKERMKKGTSNVVTIDMISEIQAEILKLEGEHKQAERSWAEKLNNLQAECASRKLQEEKKLIILREKQREAKLNDIRIKQFKKLIIQSKTERKEDTNDNPLQYRSKRNIKFFQREL